MRIFPSILAYFSLIQSYVTCWHSFHISACSSYILCCILTLVVSPFSNVKILVPHSFFYYLCLFFLWRDVNCPFIKYSFNVFHFRFPFCSQQCRCISLPHSGHSEVGRILIWLLPWPSSICLHSLSSNISMQANLQAVFGYILQCKIAFLYLWLIGL